jgi:excisionase family DNA binding protein
MSTTIDSRNVRATYKVTEAAKVAGTGERAIRNGIASGVVPHIWLGRRLLIPKNAFHRWLDSAGRVELVICPSRFAVTIAMVRATHLFVSISVVYSWARRIVGRYFRGIFRCVLEAKKVYNGFL